MTALMPACALALLAASVSTADDAPKQPAATLAAVKPDDVDYVRDVKPIFARHCTRCHGAVEQESELRLDSAAAILKGGVSGPAIVARQSGESLLIAAVTRTENRMPAEGDPLAVAEIAVLKRWIDAGAQAPDEPPPIDPKQHWSFQKPKRPPIPASGQAAVATNPIDAFLSAQREAHSLTPAPAADKRVLLRRVYLDLIGLPPTRAELAAFLADSAPDALSRVVDRLLASPQYGERWGRHWMDVWRYSDWSGYGKEVRDSQQHIWHWREWIVDSLNSDRGYDSMIVDMLAGDEAAPDDANTVRATGFLARNWYRFNRNVWLDNTVEHTSKAFLGLTMNCAKCHNHMYDPIPQADYYRMRAFFEPHEVRIDRLPGEPDTNVDGIPRVYDAHADRKTFLFVRGQDSQPKEDDPLSPGVPAVLGGDLRIEPVHLSATSYNLGLKTFVRETALKAARAAVDKATAELTTARAEQAKTEQAIASASAQIRLIAQHIWPNAKPAKPAGEQKSPQPVELQLANRAVMHAEKQLNVAQLDLASLECRIKADDARYANPPAANATALIAQALSTANHAQISAEEAAVALAECDAALTPAAQAAKKAKAGKRNKEPEVTVDAARKKLDETRKKVAERSDYPPIDQLYPATSTGRRLALARWIAWRENPLTARVAMNHIWMRHFGEPLVATVFDFGLNGKPPTHPELLDWLAVEFMDRGWSMKAMHRLIVTSQAYALQSTAAADDPRRKLDPDNVYLWRANPRRMEAEIVRDSVLFVGGKLDLTLGGPDLDHEAGLSTPRRSLYFRQANEKQMTFLKLFDVASVNECYRRSESVVPQQALALANSPLAIAQARLLAKSLWQESNPGAPQVATAQEGAAGNIALPQANQATQARFIAIAFEQVLGRPPVEQEKTLCAEFLATQSKRLANAKSLTTFDGGDSAAIKPADDPQQRAREDLVHVLLNHNDFVTIH